MNLLTNGCLIIFIAYNGRENRVLSCHNIFNYRLNVDIYWHVPAPANIYFIRVNKRNTPKRCEIFSKLTMFWCLIVNVAHITKMLYLQFVYNSLIFDSFFQCFFCWLWTGKCLLGWYVPKHFLIQHTSMKKWPDKITFFMPF